MRLRKTSDSSDIPQDTPLARTLKSPRPELSFRAIPTKLLDLLSPLCLRKRAVSDPGRVEVRINPSLHPTKTHDNDSGYLSFPPPTFRHNGQPRALDSRLYPELPDSSPPNPTLHTSFESSTQPVQARARSIPPELAFPTLACPYTSTQFTIPPIPAHLSTSLSRRPIHHLPCHRSLPKTDPLSLRGGGLQKLRDDERIPRYLWLLSGQRGKPPTAKEFREWRGKWRDKVKAVREKKAKDNNKVGG